MKNCAASMAVASLSPSCAVSQVIVPRYRPLGASVKIMRTVLASTCLSPISICSCGWDPAGAAGRCGSCFMEKCLPSGAIAWSHAFGDRLGATCRHRTLARAAFVRCLDDLELDALGGRGALLLCALVLLIQCRGC